jgi:hypothetical protein
VDLIHQDLEATIHDLMDFLGIKLFTYGCVVSHISEEHRHQFPLTLDGTPCIKDFVHQVFRCVRPGLIVVNWRGFFGFPQVVAAFIAEFAVKRIHFPAIRAGML